MKRDSPSSRCMSFVCNYDVHARIAALFSMKGFSGTNEPNKRCVVGGMNNEISYKLSSVCQMPGRA